ncbi:hypothetical protein U9M48_013900 [Paspalum notatum var. saurae]|uniref:Histone-lysine N-methyltransferase ASHH3 n=1 Tax=Paspalum notatum var. saurae TaxID=547442 RepID=A0AAQ3WJZ5_PASNO
MTKPGTDVTIITVSVLQIENVFEQLIDKIEPTDFDPLPTLKQWNAMLFSCCSSQCKCDDTCANKSFQHRPLKKTKLIKTEKCGYGLVAENEIKKGEFVIEYVGEVIDDRTCEERLWTMKRLSDTNFYLCEVSSNMVIDATNKGNRSRFINHSCEPNTEMQKWTVDGETRVGIFAVRDIKIGEELTYDYKFVQFGEAQDCHCGSSKCRKMIGTTKSVNSIVLNNGNSGSSQNYHVKKKKRKTSCENCIQQFLRLWHPRQKMYVGCWIVDFNQETKIHTLQFCDLHTENFDLKEEEWHFLEVTMTLLAKALASASVVNGWSWFLCIVSLVGLNEIKAKPLGSFLPFGVYCTDLNRDNLVCAPPAT